VRDSLHKLWRRSRCCVVPLVFNLSKGKVPATEDTLMIALLFLRDSREGRRKRDSTLQAMQLTVISLIIYDSFSRW
jgi:hypothetical protein